MELINRILKNNSFTQYNSILGNISSSQNSLAIDNQSVLPKIIERKLFLEDNTIEFFKEEITNTVTHIFYKMHEARKKSKTLELELEGINVKLKEEQNVNQVKEKDLKSKIDSKENEVSKIRQKMKPVKDGVNGIKFKDLPENEQQLIRDTNINIKALESELEKLNVLVNELEEKIKLKKEELTKCSEKKIFDEYFERNGTDGKIFRDYQEESIKGCEGIKDHKGHVISVEIINNYLFEKFMLYQKHLSNKYMNDYKEELDKRWNLAIQQEFARLKDTTKKPQNKTFSISTEETNKIKDDVAKNFKEEIKLKIVQDVKENFAEPIINYAVTCGNNNKDYIVRYNNREDFKVFNKFDEAKKFAETEKSKENDSQNKESINVSLYFDSKILELFKKCEVIKTKDGVEEFVGSCTTLIPSLILWNPGNLGLFPNDQYRFKNNEDSKGYPDKHLEGRALLYIKEKNPSLFNAIKDVLSIVANESEINALKEGLNSYLQKVEKQDALLFDIKELISNTTIKDFFKAWTDLCVAAKADFIRDVPFKSSGIIGQNEYYCDVDYGNELLI